MTAINITDLNNAKLDVDHIAAIATSTSATATDRLGGVKQTIKGATDSIAADVTALDGYRVAAQGLIDADVSTIDGYRITAQGLIDADVTTVETTKTTAVNTTIPAYVAAVEAAKVQGLIDIDADVQAVTGTADWSKIYLGAKASNPTTRNNGSALQAGDIYFNTASNRMMAYASGTWYATETAGATDAALVSYTPSSAGNGTTEGALNRATRSNAMTQNQAKLKRFWRKVYGINNGFQVCTGTATTSTASTGVTGLGTKFTKEFSIGSIVKKADGVTVIGSVNSIASDTSMTLLANALVTISGLGITTVPQLNTFIFGDSMAGMKPDYIIPKLRKQLGYAGQGLYTVNNASGGGSNGSTIGDVTSPGSFDYTYGPLGSHYDVGAAGTLTFSIGGGYFNGNYFALYYVKKPSGGTITVEFKSSGATVNSQTIDTSNATVDLGICFLNLGNTIQGLQIKVTGVSGRSIVLSTMFANKTVPGIVVGGLARGGLGIASVQGVTYPILIQKMIGDFKPDWATYEMKESESEVNTRLGPLVTSLQTYWSEIDWLFIGNSPVNTDAGLSLSNSPQWKEAEAIRAYAATNGYAYFDGYTPMGSFEAMTPFDGTHPVSEDSAYSASILAKQFGLFDWFGSIQQTEILQANSKVRTPRLEFISDKAPLDKNYVATAYEEMDPNFNLDLTRVIPRAWTVQTADGTRAFAIGTSDPGVWLRGFNCVIWNTSWTDKDYAFAMDSGNWNTRLCIKNGAASSLRSTVLRTYDTTVTGSGMPIATFMSTDVNYTDYTRYYGNEVRFGFNSITGNLSYRFRAGGGAAGLGGNTLTRHITLNSPLTGLFTAGVVVAGYLGHGEEGWGTNFGGSVARLLVAPTAPITFYIKKNGTNVGGVTFAAGVTSMVFPGSGFGGNSLAPGDVLTVEAAQSDATASGLLLNLICGL